MFESYIYYFKHWLFRKGKITNQEAALGIFLTVIIATCGYVAIDSKPRPLASETSVKATSIVASQSQVLPGQEVSRRAMPHVDQKNLIPDSAATPNPVLIADTKPTLKATPKRVVKAKPKRLSREAMVTKMLREGKSVRQIAKQTGLKRKYIREIKKRKPCNCRAS